MSKDKLIRIIKYIKEQSREGIELGRQCDCGEIHNSNRIYGNDVKKYLNYKSYKNQLKALE